MKISPFFTVILLISGNFGHLASQPRDKSKHSIEIGSEAPKFILRDTSNNLVSIRDYCGNLRKPWKNKQKFNVILNFWATYCIPCRSEIPQLEKLVQELGPEVKLLLISIDKEGSKKVKPDIIEQGYSSKVLLDIYQVAAKKYGVTSVPALFLIDSTGILRYKTYGYSEGSIDSLKNVLNRL